MLVIRPIVGGIVTPHVGVWIETEVERDYSVCRYVTPHVGVWIETESLFD